VLDDAMSAPPPASRILSFPPLILALVAIFMGSALDGFIKHLGAGYAAAVVACWRYCFGTVFSGTVLIAMKRKLPDGRTLRGHAIRAVASTISAVLFFHSLVILPIAEATVLMFCAPLVVAPLARLLLNEKLKHMAVLAIVVGFIGVVVTVQGEPLSSDNSRRLEGVLSGVGGAVLYALSIVLLRQLAQKNDAIVTAFLGNAFPALYLLVPALIIGPLPALSDIPAFAATGLFGFLLWFLLTIAYSRAPAQRLTPTEYTALIWSALIGYLFFDESPRWQVYAGAVIICAAVALAAWNDRRAKLAPPTP
jgi:S-adenosylmethionine uptake transporter